jgi:WD40-like Beta Propeller Repeat
VLDPEPPPRPWWWQAAVSVGILALAAAAGVAIVFWPSASGSRLARAATTASLPAALDHGRIVVQKLDGTLALADPDGTHLSSLKAVGVVGQSVSASLDNRYLSEGNGEVITVGTGPQLAQDRSNVPLASNNGATWPDAFADHDRALIMVLDYGAPHAISTYSDQVPVWTASLSSGAEVSLGTADAAAGDPQTPGAFVAPAAPPVATSTPTQTNPDTDIELRVGGQPALVLATAAAINADLGMVNQPVQLVPVPDPAGDKVAVVVRPVSGDTSGGIVVLTRAGHMLAVTPPGPTYIVGSPAWSPDGSTLAYGAYSPEDGSSLGASLFLWHIGGKPRSITIPAAAKSGFKASGGAVTALPVWCVWSPDGTSVLCSSDEQGRGSWLVAGTTTAKMTAVPGAGWPVAWLPGGAGT